MDTEKELRATYIKKLYDTHILQDLLTNIGKNDQDLKDLEQDLWLYFSEKLPTDLLKHLSENETECRYYMARVVLNQIKSSTSDYIKNYKKWERNKNALPPYENEKLEGTLRRIQDR